MVHHTHSYHYRSHLLPNVLIFWTDFSSSIVEAVCEEYEKDEEDDQD